MKLLKVTVKNFKCFKEEKSIECKRLTVLTGANSSGKSSLLYAILGSLQSGEFPFVFSPNGKYDDMGDFKEISYNHKLHNSISLNFIFDDDKFLNQKVEIKTIWGEDKINHLPKLVWFEAHSPSFDISIAKDKNYSLNYSYSPEKDKDVSLNFFSSGAMTTMIDSFIKLNSNELSKNKNLNSELNNAIKAYSNPQNLTGIKFSSLEKLETDLSKAGHFHLLSHIQSIKNIFTRFDDQINFISPFRLDPSRTYQEKTRGNSKIDKNGDGYLDQIIRWENKKSAKFDELISIMDSLSLFDNLKSNRIGGGRYEILVKTKPLGLFTSLSDVGFGISQFLPIIVADLQLPHDSTLFIAQPEIHLHPSVQALFGDFLTNQIRNTKKNYVIETHSEYLINRLRLAITKGELKENEMSIYYFENKREDCEIHKLKFNKKGQVLNAPEDFFKTYMMDVLDIALNSEE